MKVVELSFKQSPLNNSQILFNKDLIKIIILLFVLLFLFENDPEEYFGRCAFKRTYSDFYDFC